VPGEIIEHQAHAVGHAAILLVAGLLLKHEKADSHGCSSTGFRCWV